MSAGFDSLYAAFSLKYGNLGKMIDRKTFGGHNKVLKVLNTGPVEGDANFVHDAVASIGTDEANHRATDWPHSRGC